MSLKVLLVNICIHNSLTRCNHPLMHSHTDITAQVYRIYKRPDQCNLLPAFRLERKYSGILDQNNRLLGNFGGNCCSLIGIDLAFRKVIGKVWVVKEAEIVLDFQQAFDTGLKGVYSEGATIYGGDDTTSPFLDTPVGVVALKFVWLVTLSFPIKYCPRNSPFHQH
jgi:hypothetical protein